MSKTLASYYPAREATRLRRSDARAHAFLAGVLVMCVGFVAGIMLLLSAGYAATYPEAFWYARVVPWVAGGVFLTSVMLGILVAIAWRKSYRASLAHERFVRANH